MPLWNHVHSNIQTVCPTSPSRDARLIRDRVERLVFKGASKWVAPGAEADVALVTMAFQDCSRLRSVSASKCTLRPSFAEVCQIMACCPGLDTAAVPIREARRPILAHSGRQRHVAHAALDDRTGRTRITIDLDCFPTEKTGLQCMNQLLQLFDGADVVMRGGVRPSWNGVHLVRRECDYAVFRAQYSSQYQ